MATLNITYNGSNGDLPDQIDYDSTDDQIRQWATEAVASGGIPGLDAVASPDFTNFVVDRFPARDDLPARVMLRPKTPFGQEA